MNILASLLMASCVDCNGKGEIDSSNTTHNILGVRCTFRTTAKRIQNLGPMVNLHNLKYDKGLGSNGNRSGVYVKVKGTVPA